MTLEFEETGPLGRDLALVAVDTRGNRLTIVASVERWNEALMATRRYGPRPSRAERARAMYVRGEIEVEDFERTLEVPR